MHVQCFTGTTDGAVFIYCLIALSVNGAHQFLQLFVDE